MPRRRPPHKRPSRNPAQPRSHSPEPATPGGFVSVGRVVKPHGVRGEMTVEPLVEDVRILMQAEKLWLHTVGAEATRPRPLTPTSVRPHKGRVLLTVREVTDRNEVEDLRGAGLLLREEDLPELADDELYVEMLIGMTILLHGGGSDTKPLGTLEAVMTDPHEVWSIRTDDSDGGREVLFPVAEEFVIDVDMEAGTITIAPPEGLLELYLSPAQPEDQQD